MALLVNIIIGQYDATIGFKISTVLKANTGSTPATPYNIGLLTKLALMLFIPFFRLFGLCFRKVVLNLEETMIMTKSLADKLGIQKGMRSILINPPANFKETISPAEMEDTARLAGQFDYIHFFTISQRDFHQKFPKLKEHLNPGGMLWVSWPKSGQQQTDLSLTTVIKLGYDYGLVESKSISIDDLWSALKFTHPKKGKIYNNSYGKLKE